MCDTVLIEIPHRTGAEHLRRRLQSSWLGARKGYDGVYLAAATVPPRPDGLAWLLREVEAWGVERRLGTVRFHLDGRVYTLETELEAPAGGGWDSRWA
jgi:hypothetical protein